MGQTSDNQRTEKTMPSSKDLEIAGILTRDKNEQGLERLAINTDSASAELYLQGAHLAQWQPQGQRPVLFLSRRSSFVPGKAIRGGIPIIFPWFGARTTNALSQRSDGPSHGFARTALWQLSAATQCGDTVNLTLSLEANDATRNLGFADFTLTYELAIGAELSLKLTTRNNSTRPIHIEEAFHSYFQVGDVRQIAVCGLEECDYLDKTDALRRKRQSEAVLRLSAETDRPYLNTKQTVSIDDPLYKRRIAVAKENSSTTVVWNPWSESAKLADMEPGGWTEMVCIEAANALENAIVIEPGASHTMSTTISVQNLPVS